MKEKRREKISKHRQFFVIGISDSDSSRLMFPLPLESEDSCDGIRFQMDDGLSSLIRNVFAHIIPLAHHFSSLIAKCLSWMRV